MHQSMSNLHLIPALQGLDLGLALVILWLLQRKHLHLVHGLFWFSVAGLASGPVSSIGWPFGRYDHSAPC